MTHWIECLEERRLLERRGVATDRAKKVIEVLAQQGVKATVIGSLAEGRFALHSDVDFLVRDCPKNLKYSFESTVESIMLDLPFDVIYEDEIALTL